MVKIMHIIHSMKINMFFLGSTCITGVGNNTASEVYSLLCSYDIGIIAPATLHWSKGSVDINTDYALTTVNSSSHSQLF